MKLTKLACDSTQVADLSPLNKIDSLTELTCGSTPVSDLSPLKGISLKSLKCGHTLVSDLSPLAGMSLMKLYCNNTMISDLSPLKGMPLAKLYFDNTQISDLSPLEGMKLNEVSFSPERIRAGLEMLRRMPTIRILCRSWWAAAATADVFWKKYDAGEFGMAENKDGFVEHGLLPARAPFDAKQARAYQEAWSKYLGNEVETPNSIGMKMVLLPPGEFLMGRTDEQIEAAVKSSIRRGDSPAELESIRNAARPRQKAVLSKPLAMSETLVTIGQFRAFVDATKYVSLTDRLGGDSNSTDPENPGNKDRTWHAPGYAVTDESPVTEVSWMDAAAFCNWLSEQEALQPSYRRDTHDVWVLLPRATGYRLPSEAEWEFACRAGTTTHYSFGNDPVELIEYGWFEESSVGSSRSVRTKPANPFGLYDMQGKVEKWCADWIDNTWYDASPSYDPKGMAAGSRGVIRGGYWGSNASNGGSAIRHGKHGPQYRRSDLGFRLVRGG